MFLVAYLVASGSPLFGEKLEPGSAERGYTLVKTKCTFCHYVEGSGGMIAPPLEKGLSLANQLVRDYEKRAADLAAKDAKAYAAARAPIEAVLAEKDPARRYELWLGAYLTDTKFDNPMTKMGNVILTPQQRADIVAWLVTKRPLE